MGCLRFLFALLLVLLAGGFGLFGLCLVGVGNPGEDQMYGGAFMLLGLVLFLVGIALWVSGRATTPPARRETDQ